LTAADVATASQVGLLSTVKHFPGLGRVRVNTDTSTGAVDNTTSPADPALGVPDPFTQAIRAGVAAVMISSASYRVWMPATWRCSHRESSRDSCETN